MRIRRFSRSAYRCPAGLERLEGRALLSGGLAEVAPPGRTSDASGEVARLEPNGDIHSMSVTRNIVYTVDSGQAIKLDLYRPVGTPPPGGWPAVVGFPGGGWRWASKTQYGRAIGQLAEYGFVVAVADYTYSSGKPGTHVWPNNFEDARAAVRWVRSHAPGLEVNTEEIAAAGVSSGAYLASLLGTNPDGPLPADFRQALSGFAPRRPASVRAVSARVQAVVDFYGPVDLTAMYSEVHWDESYLDTFLGGTPGHVPDRYAAASVDTHISAAAPPFFIVQGTADRTVLASQSALLASDLKDAGVPYSLEYLVGVGHGFEFSINNHLDLLPQVVRFLHEAFHHQPITTATT
jgi:acetyl esterase/lipase